MVKLMLILLHQNRRNQFQRANATLDKALQEYERHKHLSTWDVKKLAEVVDQGDKEGIAEASNTGNLTCLECVLDLPQHLIDETNPTISGVVTAYRVSQQTKGKN